MREEKLRRRARREYHFRDGKRLVLGERTLVMGILNVTPDSFSDGGLWNTPEKALLHARQMVEDGADIIDVGAESSRPGFVPMTAEEEKARLRPFLEALLPNLSVPVSVDTFKAETAEMAGTAVPETTAMPTVRLATLAVMEQVVRRFMFWIQ